MVKCRECKTGKLEVVDCEDCLLTVECQRCGTVYDVEPDGLGDGGLEWAEAMARKEGGEF